MPAFKALPAKPAKMAPGNIGRPKQTGARRATASVDSASKRQGTRNGSAGVKAAAKQQALPLAGIRIVCLTHILAGPFATHLLESLGAEIIVVENKNDPDGARGYPPLLHPRRKGAQSLYHAALNSGPRRKYIALNFKDAADLATMRGLLAGSNAFLYNQRSGLMNKFGLDFKTLSRNKETKHLVQCHIRGDLYDDEGAFDLKVVARSGFFSSLCRVGNKVYAPPLSLADHAAGAMATNGIVAALLGQALGNNSSRLVTVSMLRAFREFWLMQGAGATREIGPSNLLGLTVHHPSIAPFTFYTTGGGFDEAGARVPEGVLAITIGTETPFKEFARLLNFNDAQMREYATNQKRVANRDELMNDINRALSTKTAEEWIKLFKPKGILAEIPVEIGEIVKNMRGNRTLYREFQPVVSRSGRELFLRTKPGVLFGRRDISKESIRIAPKKPGRDNRTMFRRVASGEWQRTRRFAALAR